MDVWCVAPVRAASNRHRESTPFAEATRSDPHPKPTRNSVTETREDQILQNPSLRSPCVLLTEWGQIAVRCSYTSVVSAIVMRSPLWRATRFSSATCLSFTNTGLNQPRSMKWRCPRSSQTRMHCHRATVGCPIKTSAWGSRPMRVSAANT
jgi:hypothetical protein